MAETVPSPEEPRVFTFKRFGNGAHVGIFDKDGKSVGPERAHEYTLLEVGEKKILLIGLGAKKEIFVYRAGRFEPARGIVGTKTQDNETRHDVRIPNDFQEVQVRGGRIQATNGNAMFVFDLKDEFVLPDSVSFSNLEAGKTVSPADLQREGRHQKRKS